MNEWFQSPYIPGLCIGLATVAIFLLGWLVGRWAGRRGERARTELVLAQARSDARVELARAQGRLDELVAQKEALANEFKTLSIATLDDQCERAEKLHRENLEHILKPLQADIAAFKEQLSKDHVANVERSGKLGQQLSDLARLSAEASTSATTLASALRGSASARGNWGETTLERLLELAELPKDVAFRTQVSLTSATDGRQRPDVIVDLPGDRHVVIDSKAVLSHYLDHVAAADEPARVAAAKAHVAALRTQIRALGERCYEALPGLNGQTPDFVLLFIPSEPALALALDTDFALFDEAAKNKVLLASPATLLAALRIIDLLWRAERQQESVAEVYSRLQAIYEKYATFANEMQHISDAIDKARAAYDKAFSLLATGRGNLVHQMEQFLQHLPRQKKDLPEPFAAAAKESEETDHEP